VVGSTIGACKIIALGHGGCRATSFLDKRVAPARLVSTPQSMCAMVSSRMCSACAFVQRLVWRMMEQLRKAWVDADANAVPRYNITRLHRAYM
jgi:hypothetical protein